MKYYYPEPLESVGINHGHATCGFGALNGGIPTSSSKRITPTDHQSAVIPARKMMWEDQMI